MDPTEADLAAAFGGPGPEDVANGAAALAAALVREAGALAAAAEALRATAVPDAISDVRRGRFVLAAAGEAAVRAAVALDAAATLAEGRPVAEHAARIAAAAKRIGLPPATLAPLLRAAALAVSTDDGAARIAASTLAAGLCATLADGG